MTMRPMKRFNDEEMDYNNNISFDPYTHIIEPRDLWYTSLANRNNMKREMKYQATGFFVNDVQLQYFNTLLPQIMINATNVFWGEPFPDVLEMDDIIPVVNYTIEQNIGQGAAVEAVEAHRRSQNPLSMVTFHPDGIPSRRGGKRKKRRKSRKRRVKRKTKSKKRKSKKRRRKRRKTRRKK